jgi:hypothetical protein
MIEVPASQDHSLGKPELSPGQDTRSRIQYTQNAASATASAR